MVDKKIFIVLFVSVVCGFTLMGQTVGMYFPHFAGKRYDFIIFQGDKQITLAQDSIPPGGRFSLVIPKPYAPYTGMSRWLLTNNKEGGGLDMVVPGHDFSVSCVVEHPSDSSIIYVDNPQPGELNRLNRQQQEILARQNAMLQAKRVFSKTEASYPVFEQEYNRQLKAFEEFQAALKANSSYAARFLQSVNVTRGIGFHAGQTEYDMASDIAGYLSSQFDWSQLYTSGHWTQVISSWIDIHTRVLKDPYRFAEDFRKVGGGITDASLYTDFAGRTAYFLTQQGRDDLIGGISQTVVSSGKISKYEGSLLVYTVGAVGSQASDLTFDDGKTAPFTLKGNEMVTGNYKKALLVFYEAGCPGCEKLLNEALIPKYDSLKSEGIRVIAVSADEDEAMFRGRSKDFPWQDTFCDYKGMKGVNFKKYGVAGTPTVFLIGKSGQIEKRMAGLESLSL